MAVFRIFCVCIIFRRRVMIDINETITERKKNKFLGTLIGYINPSSLIHVNKCCLPSNVLEDSNNKNNIFYINNIVY